MTLDGEDVSSLERCSTRSENIHWGQLHKALFSTGGKQVGIVQMEGVVYIKNCGNVEKISTRASSMQLSRSLQKRSKIVKRAYIDGFFYSYGYNVTPRNIRLLFVISKLRLLTVIAHNIWQFYSILSWLCYYTGGFWYYFGDLIYGINAYLHGNVLLTLAVVLSSSCKELTTVLVCV